MLSNVSLSAKPIDINQDHKVSILEQSDVYFDTQELNITQIIKSQLLHPYENSNINTGMLSTTIWLRFTLSNQSDHLTDKILILTSTLLEHITLYNTENLYTPKHKGVHHISKEHHTLFPYYHIVLQPHSTETYYLKVKSLLTPVDFSLILHEHEIFEYEDRFQQLTDILLIGFVLALMLYSFILYFYTKDKSYLYYSFYLFALLYQQFTYLGLTQIYFPLPFINIDMQIPVFKVNLLVITAALFAMHFLKTKHMKKIHLIYKFFITIAIVEILFLSTSHFYNLDIVILTGALFIFFNLSVGIISYKRGNKQARLFIAGFGIVFISYLLIILDALGISSIMHKYQNILMFSTAFEALFLSLAFADRYIILQKEKARVDARILEESSNRTTIIENEVIKKTKALNSALETKELLIKEIHHRVKNNLQVILSIIRLQQDEIEDEIINEKFIDLENRINAISKTYDMLLIKDNLEKIDMDEYIDSLLLDIKESIHQNNQNIEIETEIDARIPLKESVYVGLIVNELVTNAYKYAFENDGLIFISLQQDNHNYILKIQDNGKGYNSNEIEKSLGLKLIHTLVYGQLGGSLEKENTYHTHYTIRFTL
ncbi:Sensory transduction histidine kinase [hydrothermal vent metagenome]|uniref:histidine kinase n=1 Tax=hydrothermal vent metagenome TaxID=652676 RepID=A0A1W1EDW0_9ZZZZ